MVEKFDPMNVSGTSPYVTVDDSSDAQKNREQLVSEIDYERVKEDIEKIYIPDYVEKRIMEEYEFVTVRDYNDMYHKSEEERAEINQFYHLFAELRNMSEKENKIDTFIIRARCVIKALREIADNNGIFDPEDFIKDYFKGKIEIYGLPIPKLRNKFRKKYNMDYLIEFILGDEDPSEFAKDRTKSYDIEDYDITQLLPPEMVEKIQNCEDDIESTMGYFDDPDDQDNRNVALMIDRKDAKKISNKLPQLYESALDIKRMWNTRRKTFNSLNSMDGSDRYVGDIRQSDFEMIQRYDQSVYENAFDLEEPKVPDDMEDDDAVNAYLTAMDRYIEATTLVRTKMGDVKTKEEKDIDDVKEALEEGGFDLRQMYGYRENKKRLKKLQKEEAKKERELKKRLCRVQERRERRMGGDISLNDKKKKKKNKKKDKNKAKSLIEDTMGYHLSKKDEDDVFDFRFDK